MIKNRPNFIPARYETQPEFYKNYFNEIVAVFKHPTNGRNLMLAVTTRGLNNKEGNLQLQYQGKILRHILGQEHFTIKSAMEVVDSMLSKPHYGDSFKDPAVLVNDIDGPRYSNAVLAARLNKAYKAKCKYFKPKTPFILTEEDKTLLMNWGEREEDLKYIETCANQSVYLLDYETAITLEEALELLGREQFLSGIQRSTFHFTSVRETLDGKHEIHFESGTSSPYRKNADK